MPSEARILVVDDTPGTRYATCRVLKHAGFETIEAATGAEALEQAKGPIDLILLDVQLPDIHGHEVCRRLRNRPDTALLPVLHLSATFRTDQDRASGLDSGADGYLTHPVDPVVLVAHVRTLLRARRAEEQARRSDERFRELFERAPIGICTLDQQGRILDANSSLLSLLGCSSDKVRSQALSEYFLEEKDAIQNSLSAGSEWSGTLSMQRADGSSSAVYLQIKTLSDADVSLAIVQDMTDQLRFAAEREELLERERIARGEAEESNRQKDHFLAVLGHELRNPLASLCTGIELLKSPELGKERQEWVVERIDGQAVQLRGLIADLLDNSLVSHDKLTLQKQVIPLTETLQGAVDSCLENFEQRGQRFEVDLRGVEGAFVDADRLRLQQIFINLLVNASKYTPAGGVIRFTGERTRDTVTVSVIDSGVGLSDSDIERIFVPFVQVGETTQGLGLGLTVVQRLAEMHGGTISAHSDGLGKGSTFRVSLPVASSAPAVRGTRVADEPKPHAGLRAMVVDDNETAAVMLKMHLETRGYTVQTAFTGEAALQLAPTFRPQLILLDLGLPDMSGYDVAERLRRSGFERAVIAALSGFSNTEAKERSSRSGFDAHLVKPATVEQISALLDGR